MGEWGDFPSLGVHLSRRFQSRAGRKGEEGFSLSANPPGGRGIFYRRRSAPGLAKKHNLPRETKIIQSGVEKG